MHRSFINTMGIGVLFILTAGLISAAEVANLASAFQRSSFPESWSYLWNQGGALGDSKTYIKLEATPEESPFCWTPSGAVIPQASSGYLHLSAQNYAKRVRGHVGPPTPFPLFAIFAHTLKAAGTYSISDSILTNAAGEGSSGLELKVLVNDQEIITRTTESGFNQTDFDTKLGDLKADDVVYVAVGPGKTDSGDLFDIQFIINSSTP
jgi:hypothetical protein